MLTSSSGLSKHCSTSRFRWPPAAPLDPNCVVLGLPAARMSLCAGLATGCGREARVSSPDACHIPAQVIARELAKNEREHVVFLRTALGANATDMPQINM